MNSSYDFKPRSTLPLRRISAPGETILDDHVATCLLCAFGDEIRTFPLENALEQPTFPWITRSQEWLRPQGGAMRTCRRTPLESFIKRKKALFMWVSVLLCVFLHISKLLLLQYPFSWYRSDKTCIIFMQDNYSILLAASLIKSWDLCSPYVIQPNNSIFAIYLYLPGCEFLYISLYISNNVKDF